MKSLINALEKETLSTPDKRERFTLGIGKGKGSATHKKNKKANSSNPAAKGSVGHSGGKYMKLIGAA